MAETARSTTPRHDRAGRVAMVAYTHFDTDPRCRREAALAAADGWDVHFFALSHGGRARR